MQEIDLAIKQATGIAYYEGTGSILKNFSKAARYLNAVLKNGSSEASYYLEILHRSGNGMKKCNVTAFKYFEKGARSKDPKSMAELSLCYLFGQGVEVSDPLGVAYARMAVEMGDPKGMFLRASHKLYGIITSKNLNVAFDYIKKSIENG